VIIGGLLFVARAILDKAEGEIYDEEAVHREMRESHALLESKAITEEEFERREERLMERLEAIEERRRSARGDEPEDSEDDDEGEQDGDGGAS
jgi:hypothetical protein